MAKHGGVIYDGLRTECESHVTSVVASLEGLTHDAAAFLTRVEEVWTAHLAQLAMLRSVFIYLDTSYVREATGRQPIA